MALTRYKVAAVHAAPVFMDREATIEKIDRLTGQAAVQGARLVAFPEVYVPGYPVWCLLAPPYELYQQYRILYENAVEVPSAATEALAQIAKRNGVYLSVGINERSRYTPGTIWNSNLFFDPDGRLIGHHRKLVPTFAEKLVWSNGDGYGLQVHDTDIGRIGILICGENTNPLARFALLAQGEQVHISTWPCAFPAKKPGAAREYDLARAVEIRAAGHAFEGKVFNIVTAGVVDERTAELSATTPEAQEVLDRTPKPASMIIAPSGTTIAGPVTGGDQLVIAEVDLEQQVEEKPIHDVTGGYNRFDVFELKVNRFRRRGLVVDVTGEPVGLDPARGETGDDRGVPAEQEGQE